MKRMLLLLFALSLIFCIAVPCSYADGGYDFSDWTDDQLIDLNGDLQKELEKRNLLSAPSSAPPALTPVRPASSSLVDISGNTITVRDDGSGVSGKQDGLVKTVFLTNRNIGYVGQSGPIKYEVQGIQIAAIKPTTSDAASMLGLNKDQEATLVAIQLSVENTSSEDVSFYPHMSTIVTSSKEQVESDWIMSDSVGGDFFGNVNKQGQIFWICKNTQADKLTHIQWRMDGPSNSSFDRVGDNITIEFDLR